MVTSLLYFLLGHLKGQRQMDWKTDSGVRWESCSVGEHHRSRVERTKTTIGMQIVELKFGLRTDTNRIRHIKAIQERCPKFSKTSKPYWRQIV